MKQRIVDILNSKAQYFYDISDYVWDNAELGFLEEKSSAALIKALE